MADTHAMPAGPAMTSEPDEARMSVTAAMDVLDEFHIRRGDMQRVYDAIETLMEPEDDAAEAPEAPDDQAMADQMFATGRNRKAP